MKSSSPSQRHHKQHNLLYRQDEWRPQKSRIVLFSKSDGNSNCTSIHHRPLESILRSIAGSSSSVYIHRCVEGGRGQLSEEPTQSLRSDGTSYSMVECRHRAPGQKCPIHFGDFDNHHPQKSGEWLTHLWSPELVKAPLLYGSRARPVPPGSHTCHVRQGISCGSLPFAASTQVCMQAVERQQPTTLMLVLEIHAHANNFWSLQFIKLFTAGQIFWVTCRPAIQRPNIHQFYWIADVARV